MAYIFIAIHYPQPEHREDLIHSMRKMGQAMAAQPGLITAGPWVEQGGDRVVGVSRWESREAFLAACPCPRSCSCAACFERLCPLCGAAQLQDRGAEGT